MSHETPSSLENDGHRALLFTPPEPGGRVLLQTRRGSLIHDRFPDLVAAAVQQLPSGLVLDGELVVWDPDAGALSFEALQRRAAARARSAPAASTPAFFIAFDVLQPGGDELLSLPYRERRWRLEVLFAAHVLTSPWSLCPMTTDLAKAREWLVTWTDVSGVEGILIKGMNQRYLPNHRGWTKIRRRDTTEAVLGAITGTLIRPQLLVLGRYDGAGRLRAVGRTVPLRPEQARQISEHLAPADAGHPWEGVRFASSWGTPRWSARTWSRRSAPIGPSTAAGSSGIRSRLRLDIGVEDAPVFGHGSDAAAG
ncbi:ATP-dependent DNA ligase [Streptomyces sp. NPDC056544]|uniref:ATP-dependent DNA ligase n=1 Tax=unclassified Streptomyces TaxID=2593676 RepID=UPI0036987FB8